MRIVVMMLGLACARVALADISYEGEARDVAGGKLLYEEHHLLRDAGDAAARRLVLYRCPSGQLFARKLVEYGTTPAAPAFTLDDGRFGYREGVRRDGDTLQAFVREEGSAPERSAPIASAPNLVIDAGFDEFVRANWEALVAGETRAVEFVVPSRLGALGFKLRRIDQVQIDGESASRFRLSLGGMIGWFAPDIDVSYRDSDRRLMRFEGLTNIRADREDNLVARIDFPPSRARDGVDAAAWDAGLAEALTDCMPGG
jgi:hypothetical protein